MKEWIVERKWLFLLLVVQLVVCSVFIASYPIDLDEPFSIKIALNSPHKFVPFLLEGNNPPLYFILLHYWIKLFGFSVVAVRCLSLLFSVVALKILFDFVKLISTETVAIVTGIFFISSTFIHWYSIEARMYSLLIFLTILSLSHLYRLLLLDKGSWVVFGVTNAFLLYTHHLGLFILGLEFILIIFFYKNLTKKKSLKLGLASLLTLIIYSPVVMYILQRLTDFTNQGTWVAAPKWTELYGNIIRFFNYNISFFILMGLFTVTVIWKRKELKTGIKALMANKGFMFVTVFFISAYVGLYLFSILVQPLFIDRYLIFCVPFLYVVLLIMVNAFLGQHSKMLFIFTIPMLASCYYIPQTNRDGDELASFVKSEIFNETAIIITPPTYDLTFLYHYDEALFSSVEINGDKMIAPSIFRIYSFEELDTAAFSRFIVVDANSVFLYPSNNIISSFSANFALEKNKGFLGDYTVSIFKR